MMLIDGFRAEGVTRLAQDSVFMMPHLGVLSTVHPTAALEIFEKDCLVRIGTCVAPKGTLEPETGTAMTVSWKEADGTIKTEEVAYGEMKLIRVNEGEKIDAEIKPASGLDAGEGLGKAVERELHGGVVGVILDGRGRPLVLPTDDATRRRRLISWFKALDAYPDDALRRYEQSPA